MRGICIILGYGIEIDSLRALCAALPDDSRVLTCSTDYTTRSRMYMIVESEKFPETQEGCIFPAALGWFTRDENGNISKTEVKLENGTVLIMSTKTGRG